MIYSNFYPGPAKIPNTVLKRIQESLFEYKNSHISALEIFHRSHTFNKLCQTIDQKLRDIFQVPDNYSILFFEGGASLQFYLVSLNLMHLNKKVGYIIAGHWGNYAYQESLRTVGDKSHILFDGKPDYTKLCTQEDLKPFCNEDWGYLFFTSNNTVEGTQMHRFPQLNETPLVIDATSDLGLKTIQWEKDHVGVLFASCQKNLGLSGLTLVFVRQDLIHQGKDAISPVISYANHHKKRITHTPPVFNFVVLDYMLDFIKENGGISFFEKRSYQIAETIYNIIDRYPSFYQNKIFAKDRSHVNIIIDLPNEKITHRFLQESLKETIIGIEGHHTRGGIRLSFYAGIELTDIQKLSHFLENFAQKFS